MRHYEVVFLVDSNQREKISTIIEKQVAVVEKEHGNVHRVEQWGRKTLAYPIDNHTNAYYVLMNIECSLQALNEIEKFFRFSDSILRNLVIKKDRAETAESFMLIEQRKQQESKEKSESRGNTQTSKKAIEKKEGKELVAEKNQQDSQKENT